MSLIFVESIWFCLQSEHTIHAIPYLLIPKIYMVIYSSVVNV
jgi:hypothetical protein